MKKPGILLLTVVLTVCLLCGCASPLPDQTVTCGELTLTLPGAYADMRHESFAQDLALVYGHGSTVVMISSEEAASLAAYIPDMDALRYAELFIQTNKLPGNAEVVEGIPTFTYTRSADSTEITYLCGVFQSETTFWVVQVYCPTEDFSENESHMWDIIASVQI